MFAKIKKYIPNIWKSKIKAFIRNCFDSIHYYLIDGQIFNTEIKHPKHIIFVCKGNVCRSAFAEKLMALIATDMKLKIESCGLDVDQGRHPPPESVNTARKFSCSLSGHISKGLDGCDLDNADLILSMEYKQHTRLLSILPHKKKAIKLLRSYAPFPYSVFCNIDDPYGWGKHEFRKAFRLIERSLKRIV